MEIFEARVLGENLCFWLKNHRFCLQQLDVGSKLNNVSLLCLPMAVFTVEHLNDAQGYRLSL
jgi:hypothetical protein